MVEKDSPQSSRGFLAERSDFLMASSSLAFRFDFWLKPIEMSNGKNVEEEKEPSPKDPSPEARGQLRDGRRHHSIPIDKSQNEDKKDREKNETFEDLLPP